MRSAGVRRLFLLALHLAHGLFEHRRVHLKADRLDVAGLFAAEHVAGAAEFEIERGDLESRAQVGELLERGQAAARNLSQLGLRRNQQVRIGAAIRTANPAAELIQLAETMAIGAVDDDGVGERDIQAVLDDGGRHQHVVLVVHEGEHDALQLRLGELAVADDDAGLRHQFANLRSEIVDRLHPVVDEVGLAATLQLHLDCGAHQLLVELGDDGLNSRRSVHRQSTGRA